MILDFTVATFQKEKQFYCAKVSYKPLDYNTSLTCVLVTFVVSGVQVSLLGCLCAQS